MKLKLKAGKTYRIKHAHGGGDVDTIHVDFILDNPTLAKYKEHMEYPEHQLIVYRVWHKYKKYWRFYVEPYWSFCMWNNWPYTK